MIEPQSQPPLVLIASEGEWVGRSLGNILELHGYTVLRVETGRRALELARRTNPEAILLDDDLPDIGGVDVCRALRDDPLFNQATPIVITAAAQEANRVRASAYAAGAWDYCTHPVDVETLLLKLGTFIRARREIDEAKSKGLVDRGTGLYSEHGLHQWVDQLGAMAVRRRTPMACLVVRPDVGAGADGGSLTAEQASDALAAITDVCRSESRKSDVVGYLGDSRVAILAPDTDAAGVVRLIGRLQEALAKLPAKAHGGKRSASLRAGYCAISNLADANVAPFELVRRAETALNANHGHRDSAAVSFDETLLS